MLKKQTGQVLSTVEIVARRLLLDVSDVAATVPMLRGVWGAALYGLDREAYESVFHSDDARRPPSYILRPAPADREVAPALDCIFFGKAIGFDGVLMRAWDVASGMGLGKLPERRPFYLRKVFGLLPDASLGSSAFPWPLSDAEWPLAGPPESTPCRLRFITPLSLHHSKQLIHAPTLTDVVAKGCRRLGCFLPEESMSRWNLAKGRLIDLSKQIPAARWQGERLDLKRYSAAQQREFEVPGVCGFLDLPQGPGELWPLLSALQWLHLGKSTNVGLGQLVIEPLLGERRGA
jgi:hypothetical protein